MGCESRIAISASYATASVTEGTGTNNYTGGLVGCNVGSIIASYATASVTGVTGGLVGRIYRLLRAMRQASVTGGEGIQAVWFSRRYKCELCDSFSDSDRRI